MDTRGAQVPQLQCGHRFRVLEFESDKPISAVMFRASLSRRCTKPKAQAGQTGFRFLKLRDVHFLQGESSGSEASAGLRETTRNHHHITAPDGIRGPGLTGCDLEVIERS